MAAGNPPRRRRGLPRVPRRVGGGVHPPRPPVGAGRAGRHARGAEPLHEPRDGRRWQQRITCLHRLVRAKPRRPVAAPVAAPRRVGPCPRQSAAEALPPAPGRHHASSLTATALRARGGGGGASSPATSSVRQRRLPGSTPARPPAVEYPRPGGSTPRTPCRHHRRRPADSGEGVGLRTRWRSSPAVRVVVLVVGGGEHPAATLPTGRKVGVGGMAPRHPATRAVTAVARHSTAVASTLKVTRGRHRHRLA